MQPSFSCPFSAVSRCYDPMIIDRYVRSAVMGKPHMLIVKEEVPLIFAVAPVFINLAGATEAKVEL
jgi:hypothetical protein